MIIHNPILTGSFTYNGADISSLLSSSANITSLNAATASLNTFSASVLTFTGSVNTFTGSADSRLSSLEAATASLYTATSSFSGRVGALESYTASQDIRNTTYATTGSNTLVGTQYISNTNDAIGFSATTSSIYTDGGLQVTKNAYFSSSMFVKGNLTVYGTQSVSFITSSQLNISTNLITVNTSTPSVRFGGLAVYDSGSTGLTGSILWDSQNNHWVYTNPSGSSYSGGMLISGPRASSLGEEQGTTLNAIMKGMGGDHITSSAMFESGSNVGIGITNPDAKLQVVGSFGQQIRFGTNTSVYTNISMGSGFTTFDSIGGDSGAYSFRDDGTTRMFIDSSGNVGIGTTNPSTPFEVLHSSGNGIRFITNDVTSSNNAGIIFYNNASSSAADRRSYILIDPNGGNGSGGDYAYLDMFGSGNLTLMNQLGSGVISLGIGGTKILYTTGSNSGQISIGSASPVGTEKFGVTRDDGVTDGLHVIADFNRSGASSAELILGYYASGSAVTGPVVYAANSQPLLFAAGSAERMRLTTAGYVGIGTTNPATRLHTVGFAGGSVPGATGIPSLGFANSSSVALFTNNDTNYGTLFGTLNTGVGWIQQQRVDGTGTAYNLLLQPNGGNAGIGTSTPVSTDLIGALTVVKKYEGDTPTSTTAQLYYTNQSALYLFGRNSGISIISNNNEEGHIQFGNASTTRYARITTGTGTSSVGGDMYFHVGSDTERMRITTGGNVGIGTTNPLARLDIKGSADPYDILIGRYHNGNAKLIYAYQSGADGYLELRTGADATVTKLSGYTGTPSYFLSRVLVGQTTPDLGTNGWNLQTDGGGHTSFAINNNEAFIFNNRNTGTTFEIDFRTNATERGKISVTDSGVSYITTPSDINLKKNFEDWNENVLNNFKNLNPQKFNFATEENTQPKTKGFIAQELVESFPEAYPKSKDRYFFNPSGMVVYLMKAIQELKAEIDALKAQ